MRDVCDWAKDEQPSRLQTTQAELCALPLLLELDDLHAMGERHLPVTREAPLLTDSFEPLYRDGRHNGRLMMLHLPPGSAVNPSAAAIWTPLWGPSCAARGCGRRAGARSSTGTGGLLRWRHHGALSRDPDPTPGSDHP